VRRRVGTESPLPTGLPGRRFGGVQVAGHQSLGLSTPRHFGAADDPTIKDASTMRQAYVRRQFGLEGVFAELLDHTAPGTSSEPPTGWEGYLPQQIRVSVHELRKPLAPAS
jgi:hypothetical protein